MFKIDPIQEEHYNVRMRVLNAVDYFADWKNKSEIVVKNTKAHIDIRYGAGEKATLDLFLPDGDVTHAPVHIFIHGGYWKALDKADHSFVAKAFVELGIAVLVVNYDLCPSVHLSHIVDQMGEMMAWVANNASSYGLDTDQVHISGHSAGGHLAACLLTRDLDIRIKSCVAISGLYDLKPLVNTSMNQDIGLSDEDAVRLSPLGQKCFSICPVLAIVGGAEGAGFLWQSQQGVEDWMRQGLTAEIITPDQANHFDVLNMFADPGSDIFDRVMSLYSAAGVKLVSSAAKLTV